MLLQWIHGGYLYRFMLVNNGLYMCLFLGQKDQSPVYPNFCNMLIPCNNKKIIDVFIVFHFVFTWCYNRYTWCFCRKYTRKLEKTPCNNFLKNDRNVDFIFVFTWY